MRRGRERETETERREREDENVSGRERESPQDSGGRADTQRRGTRGWMEVVDHGEYGWRD
jgi:hypothetical protein